MQPALGLAPTGANIIGLLSVIVWSMTLVISIKYVGIVMRADNRGEGGVLALSTLLLAATRNWRLWSPIAAFGMVGAALFFGDGFITPPVSILGAMEGLVVVAPDLEQFIVPITLVVLLVLFSIQKRGTGTVGKVFGPIMVLWFGVLALLGLRWITQEPQVLHALNPWHAVRFFMENGSMSFIVLSYVFLAVTGGEALYADMGHFGKSPIRRAWFWIVFPALALNYFGQGAVVLRNPQAIENPFYICLRSGQWFRWFC